MMSKRLTPSSSLCTSPFTYADVLISRMADASSLVDRGNIIHNVDFTQREEHHTKHPINEQIGGRRESIDHIEGKFIDGRGDHVKFTPYDPKRRGDDTQKNDVSFNGFRRRYDVKGEDSHQSGGARRGDPIFDHEDPINEGTHRRGNGIDLDYKKPPVEWSKPDPSHGKRRANDIDVDYKKPPVEWSKKDPSIGNKRASEINGDIPWDPTDPFIGNKRNDFEPEINVRPPVEKSRRPDYPKRDDKSTNAKYDLDINVKHPAEPSKRPDWGNKRGDVEMIEVRRDLEEEWA